MTAAISQMINELDSFMTSGIPETFTQSSMTQKSITGGFASLPVHRIDLTKNQTARSVVIAMRAVLQKGVGEPTAKPHNIPRKGQERIAGLTAAL